MDRAVRKWAEARQPPVPQDICKSLHKPLAKSYTLYGTMLLLSKGSLESNEWKHFAEVYAEADRTTLLSLIAKEMKVTHIAVTNPIPLHREQSSTNTDETFNVIRSPLNFTPVYGDFGPSTCASPPSQADFDAAYWTTAKQNGIAQTWAPRWTMFSRGNISEKARVLSLPSVAEAIRDGFRDGSNCAAVDLYAGIGYFAFSYVKAGFSKVLCWDLNEWSCEGLRRGAKANRWRCRTYDQDTTLECFTKGDEKFLIFNETNELAKNRINVLKEHLPPIRHVNCGLLPTSKASWSTAVHALDRARGGWIHVHENFAQTEIDNQANKVKDDFQQLVDGFHDSVREVALESINLVKTYAPGVYHCVLDIYIPPQSQPVKVIPG